MSGGGGSEAGEGCRESFNGGGRQGFGGEGGGLGLGGWGLFEDFGDGSERYFLVGGVKEVSQAREGGGREGEELALSVLSDLASC